MKEVVRHTPRIIQERPGGYGDVLRAPSQEALGRELNRARRRGELSDWGHPVHVRPGLWAMPVARLKAPPPPPAWWRKWLILGAVLGVILVGLGLVLAWITRAIMRGASAMLAPVAELGFAGVLGLIFAVGLVLALAGGTCTTIIKVTHHH